jgi:hypothetical protein
MIHYIVEPIPMTAPKIDFTWYRDAKGYRLIPERPRPARRPQQTTMDWLLSTKSSDIQPARVVGKGGPLRSDRPLDKFPELFKIFVEIPRTPEGVLEFINKFGPLTRSVEGDSVPAVLDVADMMQKRLHGLNPRLGGSADIPLTNLQAWLANDRATGGIMLKMAPATLRDALWLQLAQNLSSGVKVRQCRHCNKWFRAGPGTDRRADAEFCKDEHRKRYNSLERSR